MPFPASEHALRITTDEVNPDVDIHPPNTYDVIISQGLAYPYSPDGRCIESLSLQAFSRLHRRYYSTPTPASDPPLDTFPAALARLLYSNTKGYGHHQTQHTLTGHSSIPTAVLDTIMLAYDLQTHWLAGPLQAHAKAANFAPCTCTAASARFGALGDAYEFHWCGSGLVTPTHDTHSLQKSIRWSIASACQAYPTLNVLIAPAHADMHAIHRLLRHPYVHSLIRLPAAACKPSQVSTWWGKALPNSTQLHSDAQVYVIANPAGLPAYAPADVHRRLHQTLQTLRIPGYQLGHHPAQYIGPLPRFRAPPGFQAAHIPYIPDTTPWSAPLPNSAIHTAKTIKISWGNHSVH